MALKPNKKIYVAECPLTGNSAFAEDKPTAVKILLKEFPETLDITIYETIKK